MKIYTSYFYQIRFFPKTLVPISTAVWDPKWYHDFKGQDYSFLDKRGVLNGLRYQEFVPGRTCNGLCRGLENCVYRDPKACQFLRVYREQLNQLNCKQVVSTLEQMSASWSSVFEGISAPNFAFIVHESPDNLCSERIMIQEWFQDNGFHVVEWERS